MASKAPPTRWGIAAAGKISQDFVNAIKTNLTSEDHVVIAVAARNLSSAKEFAARFDIPTALEGYQNLAIRDDVDVVYIGVLHPQHLEVAKIMIEAGKNVLCEKPMAMNVRQTKEMVALAREKNVFLMEGMWSRFNPIYVQAKKAVDEGLIGEVKVVDSTFGFNREHVDRVVKKELGGGTMLDLGVYSIHLVTTFLGYKNIKNVSASGLLFDSGVDKSISGTLVYDGERVGRFLTHASVRCPNFGEVIGTKGIIRFLSPMYTPTQMYIEDEKGNKVKELNVTTGKDPKYGPYTFPNSGHLQHEAEHVRECLVNGLKESPKLPLEETIAIADVLEKCRKAVGVEYPEDLGK